MKSILLAASLMSGLSQAAVPATEWAKKNLPKLVPLYRQLHENPELSFAETKTAATMAKEFKEAGFEVTTGVGKNGVVAVLKNGPGRTILLRADMDALPVTETTGLSYASKVKVKQPDGSERGIMHACGHDVHMSNLIGTARFLSEHRADWKGTLVLIAQPAEEKGGGAEAMMKDGLFKRFPKPDLALALHADGDFEAGKVSYHPGFSAAAADSVNITMRGRGGHGAKPQSAIDPVYLASLLVVELQALVSRERDPVDPSVITVGSIHGGTKHNIIPESVDMQLTVRSFSPETRKALLAGIERKAKAVAAGAGAPAPSIEVEGDYVPAVYNDPALVNLVLPSFKKVLGEKNVIEVPAVMGAEDFGMYAQGGFPVFIYWLGTIEPKRFKKLTEEGKEPPSLHSSIYYPDIEPTLVAGIGTLGTAAVDLFNAKVPLQ